MESISRLNAIHLLWFSVFLFSNLCLVDAHVVWFKWISLAVTSPQDHICVGPWSGWPYQGFRQIRSDKITISLKPMIFVKKLSTKDCFVLFGMNQAIGGEGDVNTRHSLRLPGV